MRDSVLVTSIRAMPMTVRIASTRIAITSAAPLSQRSAAFSPGRGARSLPVPFRLVGLSLCRQQQGLTDEILFGFGHSAGSARVSQRLRAPTSDLRPGGVDRGETSSGELRLERQYRDRWR